MLVLVLSLVACQVPDTTVPSSGSVDVEASEVLPRPPAPFDLDLSVSPVVAGGTVTVTVGGADPGDDVYLAGTMAGFGTSAPMARLGGRSVDILGPYKILGPYVADASGEVTLEVPARAFGAVGEVHQLQAARPAGTNSWLSQAVEVVVEPLPHDQDGDGVDAYPWGTDTDDDGDGAHSFLVGGTDIDDSDAAATTNGGTATWDTPTFEPVARLPSALSLGDFDNDGFLDMVVAHTDLYETAVLQGHGDGTFTRRGLLPYSATDGVTVGDFDEDGLMDHVSGSPPVLYRGNGAFRFTRSDVEPGLHSVSHHRAMDVNADGHLDVLADRYGVGVVLWLGNGDGSFQPSIELSSPSCNTGSYGDVDGDGDIDAVLACGSTSAFEIWHGDGAGGFSLATTVPTTDYVFELVLADIDGDGDEDVMTSSRWVGVMEVYRQQAGVFTRTQEVLHSDELQGMVSVDIDGDGDDDVLAASQLGGTWLLPSNGDGTFQTPVVTAYTAPASGLNLADLDGDGVLDQVVTDSDGERIGVSMGR